MSLKKFISDNRVCFDNREHSENLWERIEHDLDKKKEPKRGFRWAIAASVAMLIGLGYMAGRYAAPVADNKEVISLSPTYGTQMVQFSSLVEDKLSEVETFNLKNPKLVSQFEADLKELQVDFEVLKNTLPNNPNQELILDEMVNNLRWQMKLLDQQLELLKKVKESDEMVNSKQQNLSKEIV